MGLEGICTISVGDLLAEALGQVNNFDRVEGTSFNTHAATNTKVFRDKANGRSVFNVNTDFPCLVQGASLGAFLFTFFGLALIWVDNGNSEL